MLGQLLDRIDLEIAGAWLAADPARAHQLEGQAETFAVWREAELVALVPESRHAGSTKVAAR